MRCWYAAELNVRPSTRGRVGLGSATADALVALTAALNAAAATAPRGATAGVAGAAVDPDVPGVETLRRWWKRYT